MRDCCGFLAVGFLRGRQSERAIAKNLAISGSEPEGNLMPAIHLAYLAGSIDIVVMLAISIAIVAEMRRGPSATSNDSN